MCPDTDLVMTERQGVEIDYCPKCRGVWLDRGELDKIIERSTAAPAQLPPQAPVPPWAGSHPEHYGRQSGHHGGHDSHYGGHRKKSWLGEIFD